MCLPLTVFQGVHGSIGGSAHGKVSAQACLCPIRTHAELLVPHLVPHLQGQRVKNAQVESLEEVKMADVGWSAQRSKLWASNACPQSAAQDLHRVDPKSSRNSLDGQK